MAVVVEARHVASCCHFCREQPFCYNVSCNDAEMRIVQYTRQIETAALNTPTELFTVERYVKMSITGIGVEHAPCLKVLTLTSSITLKTDVSQPDNLQWHFQTLAFKVMGKKLYAVSAELHVINMKLPGRCPMKLSDAAITLQPYAACGGIDV